MCIAYVVKIIFPFFEYQLVENSTLTAISMQRKLEGSKNRHYFISRIRELNVEFRIRIQMLKKTNKFNYMKL